MRQGEPERTTRKSSLTECQRRRSSRAGQAASRGIRQFIVQCSPVCKYAISVVPSKDLSAEFSSLVPKPAAPTVVIGGPSVSSQTMDNRSPATDHATCSSPLVAENAPYLLALVASS